MATPTNLPGSFSVGETLTSSDMNLLRGAFRILQVLNTSTSTQVGSASTTFVSSGLSLTVTPQATSSKILLVASLCTYGDSALQGMNVRYRRNSTTTLTESFSIGYQNVGMPVMNNSFIYMDSPNSTSAQTYVLEFNRAVGSGNVYCQVNGSPSHFYLFEVSA